MFLNMISNGGDSLMVWGGISLTDTVVINIGIKRTF